MQQKSGLAYRLSVAENLQAQRGTGHGAFMMPPRPNAVFLFSSLGTGARQSSRDRDLMIMMMNSNDMERLGAHALDLEVKESADQECARPNNSRVIASSDAIRC
jgi:hypothetical protein